MSKRPVQALREGRKSIRDQLVDVRAVDALLGLTVAELRAIPGLDIDPAWDDHWKFYADDESPTGYAISPQGFSWDFPTGDLCLGPGPRRWWFE